MVTLHLMGGARLVGDEGRLRGEPAQRHRLALLALLALAPEARVPRERLVALLWPDHGPRESRQLLNVSLHVLRKALGRSAIVSEGDDLRLDLERVRCDAVEFREAAEPSDTGRGDAGRAIELYAGPFMDGFYLDGSNDFERWQEDLRRRLDTAYRDALAARASEAEAAGDLSAAIGSLRALTRQRPTDAPATLELMRLLEVRGDPAGALRAAADHAAAMAEAFDAEPSPEVERLARRIREHPAPATTGDAPEEAATVAEPEGEGDPVLHTGDPVLHMGDPVLHTGDPVLHMGDPVLHTEPRSTLLVSLPLPARGRRARWVLVAAIVAAFALPLTLLAPGTTPSTPPDRASVAVLPFSNMSAGGDQDYFSDGLTEEILNALAQTPGLRVAARSSSFQFRGDGVDVRSVGRALDVGAVVEGSVRVDADRLRVTTQLIDAETGYHVWSEQYDRRISDVFAVQEDIARAVATALSAELARRLPDTLVSASTANPAAYRLYLRGRHEWAKRTEEGMWAALDAFQEAVALDPSYAGAYAGLADTWQLLPDYGDVESADGLARAKTAALRAVALDSTLAEAHVALAALQDDYDRDRAKAEASYRRAIELNPSYATARHWLGIHLADDGRFDEALRQIEQARRLDPLSGIVNTAVGAVRYFAGDYDGAVAEYRAVLDLQPDFAIAHALLGRAQLVDGRIDEAVVSLERAVSLSQGDPSYRAVLATALAAAGRREEARTIADDIRAGRGEGYVPYCELASAYLRLGDREQALTLFEAAFDGRDPALKHIAVEPLYEEIRGNPRFEAVVRRAGLSGS